MTTGWILCTSGSAIAKAGANANTTIVASGSVLLEWSKEVEATICTTTRKDWITAYSSLGANFKEILNNLSSDLIAMKIISYDPSGYASQREAELMLDVLYDNQLKNMQILREQENKEVMD